MRIKFFIAVAVLCSLFVLNACGVTYPKETLIESLEALVLKESGVEAKVFLAGQTLYLDLELDDLVSKEQQKVYDATMKMQSGLSSITRVVLSSDAEVKYMAVNAFDSKKNILLRAVMGIEDVKNYFYQRISHDDYMSRSIFEFESSASAAQSVDDKHDISVNEFVGRMILSQMNVISRKDTQIGTLIYMLQLKYEDVDSEKNLILSAASDIGVEKDSVISAALMEEVKKYSQKYGLGFKNVILVNRNNNSVIEMPVNM